MATDDRANDGVWRDEERLPLADLMSAVATSADDGQRDDLADNDAGIEQTLAERAQRSSADERAGDPDPTGSEGRALRSDFNGPSGPH
jgi:hypothetical protein